MATSPLGGSPSGHSASRRRTPRLDAHGLLCARFESDGRTAIVRDISDNGFALLTESPVEPGMQRMVRFSLSDGASEVVLARVAHCERLRMGTYMSGWAPVSAAAQEALERLLDGIIGASFIVDE